MSEHTPIRDVGDPSARTTAGRLVDHGELIVYPTETVYGLGADATDPDAVQAVFAAKRRDRDDPISVAVPTLEAAYKLVEPTPRGRALMESFLPGPVTVVCEKRDGLPAALTGGRPRVGIRIPDHDHTLALLKVTGPLTATSANRSGQPSARDVRELDSTILESSALMLDGGRTPGGGSTVVDVAADRIIRRGRQAEAVERWLAE